MSPANQHYGLESQTRLAETADIDLKSFGNGANTPSFQFNSQFNKFIFIIIYILKFFK